MRYLQTVLVILVSVFVFSCTSNEIGNSKDVNPETIWFDYKIWGEEGNDDATVMLQYRFGGSNGTTLTLDEPSKVELDGKPIKGDSSKMTGAFYEVQRPVSEFAGKHSIVFTDMNRKQYKEEFNFQPISIITQLPEAIGRGDIMIELQGLDPVDYVRVLLTDTSFTSDGVNRVDTVKNGKLLLSKSDFEKLVNGPVHLELVKEDEKRVKDATPEGGRISVSYALRREFILKD
jgi:hypothetical protein